MAEANRRQRRAAAKEAPQAAQEAPTAPEPTGDRARFEAAAGAMRKALGSLLEPAEIEDHVKGLAEKCGYDYVDPQPTAVWDTGYWRAFGGATSFDEYERYQKAQRTSYEYDELNWVVGRLMDNVLQNGDLSDGDKAARIRGIADEFATRADTIGGKDGQDAFIAGKDTPLTSGFTAYKQGDEWRWFAIYSNRFYDREGEVFPEAGHQEFVQWADANKAMPELWDWHTPIGLIQYRDGRKGMGVAETIGYNDGLAWADGRFFPEFHYAAEALSQRKDLGVSHGYEYRKEDAPGSDGAYKRWRTFEISPLPRTKAANPLTDFQALRLDTKESIMSFTPEKRAALVTTHGEDAVKALEGSMGVLAKSLSDSGIAYKDIQDALATSSPTAPGADGASAVLPVRQGDAAPAGGTETDAQKAMKEIMTSAVSEGIAPLVARIDAIEAKQKSIDEQVADAFGPRVQPRPDLSPSNSDDNVVHGNTKEVQAAKKDGDGTPEGVPEHLAPYFGAGAIQFMSTAAGAAANPAPAAAGA